MSSSAAPLIEFVLARLAAEPLEVRAKMYRHLAELSPRNEEKRELQRLAAACEAISTAHEQLALDFRKGESR